MRRKQNIQANPSTFQAQEPHRAAKVQSNEKFELKFCQICVFIGRTSTAIIQWNKIR